MTVGEHDAFLHKLRSGTIAGFIESGFAEHQAAAIVDVQLAAAFPSGRPLPGHQVCCVIHDECEVGHVWFGPDPATTAGGWWLFELGIDDVHRGEGLGTRVIALVEREAGRRGGTAVGLRVFDRNTAARRLYDRLGYRAVSTWMRKVL